MNRLVLVRHGGSTGNEDSAFYAYNDSAICLTTNGIRQALNTAQVLDDIDPTGWSKPGNFDLEVFASEYARAQQTARIVLDQMGLLSITPRISSLLNERNYGTNYLPDMDAVADFSGNQSESSIRARVRTKALIRMVEPILERADVLCFSHFGTMRALIANLTDLSDAEMTTIDIPNGRAFLFERQIRPEGGYAYIEQELPDHILEKVEPFISPVPAI